MQQFFESTHFGSVQHRSAAVLEEVLRERFRLGLADREVGAELRPLRAQVDPNKRVDPVDLMYRWTRNSQDTSIPQDALLELLAAAHQLLLEDGGPLLDLRVPEGGGKDPKLVIVGDTHGQLLDVLHIFHTHGPPSESCTYLFNGDIADRGPQAVEILILVLAFKLRFPRRVHFLRGNHENREINERPKDLGGGFLQECLEKYGEHVYEKFQGVFSRLPLFAVVQEKVFVVHAGLFRTPDVTLDMLRGLASWQQHYPMFNGRGDLPDSRWSDDQAILFDAQWGDPHPMEGFRPSRRGPGVVDFGRDVTERFLDRNGLSLCVRSHECPRSGRGFAYAHGRRLLTVFSASNYGGVMGNRGAVAVLRPAGSEAPATSSSERLEDLGGATLQVIEHDISMQSPESGSAIFRQASLARRASEDCPLLQPALAIVLFNREALRARCMEADAEGTGHVSKEFLLGELASISRNIDWERIFECLAMNSDVAYNSFLGAIRVRWMYSTVEQASRLAAVMLRGELPFQDLVSLFGIREGGDEGESCRVTDLHRAVKLISPDITQWQLDDLVSLLGGATARPQDFIARLMLFAPPLPGPQEAWVRSALAGLGKALRSWASTADVCFAACQFFSTHAPEGTGLMSQEAMAQALEELLLASAPADLDGTLAERLLVPGGAPAINAANLATLVDAVDSNSSGTVSFVELARALAPALDSLNDGGRDLPPALIEAVATHAQRNVGVAEFVFSYRGALLRGCRFVDTHGTGLLEPEVFVEVAEALSELVGSPLSERQLEQLRAMLGSRLVPYALALSRFEKALEKDEASLV